ncbi:hypothetical protein V495_03611 [Pseudogymnoascus sp. VKM F-4514 (FW-929)]|nr:hypothetical protein V495_03611 [Pseudogymnoascus sp. VKM F-4514 (FW-929)]KFY66456.1 hypothetical protein V497_00912 [Pseudogymnoascus sp. VKM F-4516 (FW-969)]
MDTHSVAQPVEQAQVYASYGKACLYCVKSKTRCVSIPNGPKCERCQRLKKDCQPASTVRKKRVSKRPAASVSAKTAALEQKLDSIVQILQRSQGSITSATQQQLPILTQDSDPRAFADQVFSSRGTSNAGEASHTEAPLQSTCNNWHIAARRASVDSSQAGNETEPYGFSKETCLQCRNGHPTPADSRVSGSIIPETPDSADDFPLESDAELEEALETYRTEMVPNFPIVCIRPDVTVDQMRLKRPFLFLVIRAICSKNLRRQQALVVEVKKTLGREMLLEGSKNLDLFLGVLVFAGWCHFYIYGKPILSTVIQLGMSLAYDLGLTKPLLGEHADMMRHYIIAHGCPKRPSGPARVMTMEERRAAVGLYLVSSVAANYFQRNELMRWTPYLGECLRMLEDNRDYPTDLLLVRLVRLQLICNKGTASTWEETFGDTAHQVPPNLYAKSLKCQLDDLERSIPVELKSNAILQLHIHATTLTIHAHCLTSTPPPSFPDPVAQLLRLESLWATFTAVKSWFSVFLSLDEFPLARYPYVSIATLTQLGRCLAALYRLTSFQAAGVAWCGGRVRAELDIGDVTRLLAERWDTVSLEDTDGECMDPWTHATKRALGIGNWWEGMVAKLGLRVSARDSSGVEQVGEMASGQELAEQQHIEDMDFNGVDVDILDDPWMMELLGGGYDFNTEPQMW